jgi:hypothetical protein
MLALTSNDLSEPHFSVPLTYGHSSYFDSAKMTIFVQLHVSSIFPAVCNSKFCF